MLHIWGPLDCTEANLAHATFAINATPQIIPKASAFKREWRSPVDQLLDNASGYHGPPMNRHTRSSPVPFRAYSSIKRRLSADLSQIPPSPVASSPADQPPPSNEEDVYPDSPRSPHGFSRFAFQALPTTSFASRIDGHFTPHVPNLASPGSLPSYQQNQQHPLTPPTPDPSFLARRPVQYKTSAHTRDAYNLLDSPDANWGTLPKKRRTSKTGRRQQIPGVHTAPPFKLLPRLCGHSDQRTTSDLDDGSSSAVRRVVTYHPPPKDKETSALKPRPEAVLSSSSRSTFRPMTIRSSVAPIPRPLTAYRHNPTCPPSPSSTCSSSRSQADYWVAGRDAETTAAFDTSSLAQRYPAVRRGVAEVRRSI